MGKALTQQRGAEVGDAARWPRVRLGDVCEVLDSKRKPITKKDRVHGDIPYYGATGQVDSVADYIFDEKLVLLGEDGAKWEAGANSAFIVDGKTWVNNHAHVLRPIGVLHEYLVYCLNTADLMPYITGVTVPKLNQQRMCEIEIPLPPLPVQREIVARLERELGAVDKLAKKFEELESAAEAEFKAELKETFEEIKHRGTETQRLGEIGRVAMCKRVLKSQTTSQGEIPFYKIGTFGKVANAFISRKLFDEFVDKYSYPQKGDVLISAAGTIGRVVVFDGKPAYFQDSNIVWLEHDGRRVLNEYLRVYYLSSPWNVSDGATIPRLYNGDIEGLEIPIPPLPAQREVVARLDAAKEKKEKLVAAARRGRETVALMRKAILKEAFE